MFNESNWDEKKKQRINRILESRLEHAGLIQAPESKQKTKKRNEKKKQPDLLDVE